MSTQSIHNIQITCPYTKSMKIQSRHKPPSSPYLYSPYLSPPLATKHQKGRRSNSEPEKAGSSGWVRWKTESGGVGVVVCPVVVDRRGLLLDRSRRSSRSSWSSGSNWLGDARGVRRRSRRDGSLVWLSGAHNGRSE